MALAGPASWLASEAFADSEEPPSRPFNLRFIGNGQGVDLAEFLRGNSVAPGRYRVDLYVNQALSGRQDVEFRNNPATGLVEPCLNRELLHDLGVDVERLIESARLSAVPLADECLSLPALVDQASVDYQADALRLNLGVPQVALRRSARGYVDPALWDAGVPVAFVTYNFNANHSQARQYTGQTTTDRYFLGVRNGVNLGGWRLRNDAALSGPSGAGQSAGFGGRPHFSSNRTYAQHDVDTLKSQLTVGESYSPAQIFDSVRFRGLQVASDEGMLPDSERGYAPVVRGIAQSSATVEIRQNDFLVYSAQVAPGPFEISDLGSSGSNGDLLITIIEADGRHRSYIQAFATPPLMLRNGSLRYSLTAGQYASHIDQPTPAFASGTLAYGLSDSLTGFGGSQWAADYRALNLGIGLNTALGAVSLDVTQSDSVTVAQQQRGKSWRVQYGTLLSATDTRLSVASYRYSSAGYRSFADHVADAAYQDQRYTVTQRPNDRPRDRLVVAIDQSLGAQRGAVYLQASAYRYWQKAERNRQWQVGYNSHWGLLSYGVSGAWSDASGRGGEADRQLSVELSWPLGSDFRSPRLSSTVSQRSNDGLSSAARLTGYVPGSERTTFLLEGGGEEQAGGYGLASLATDSSPGHFNASYEQGRSYRSASIGATGSVVAHQGGVNLGQSLSDTFALVEVQRLGGVRVSQFAGVKTAGNGFAVVPNAQPYRLNWLGLDTGQLSADMEIANTVTQVVPRRGSVTLARFVATQGRRVQFALHRADGSDLPLGAMVDDSSGRLLGMVDPASRALVLTEQDRGVLHVRWSAGTCDAAYVLPAPQAGRNYLSVAAVCQ